MVNAHLGMGYDLSQRLAAIESQLRALSTQPVLLHASTGQDGGQGLSTDKAGLHLYNPSGVEVVTLSTLDGSATLGNTTITGNLAVPNGSISNNALAAPIKMAAIYADADGFTLTPTEADFCSATFTVPDGYTTALIKVDGTVNAYNTNAAADYLWARAYIDSDYGRRLFNLMAATSGPASLAVNKQLMLTGLAPGQVITCKLKLSTQTGTVTSTSNGASMNASALFTR